MTQTYERVAAHRARMRERGYREVRLWVPDVRSEQFIETAERATLAMNQADISDDIGAWLDDTDAMNSPEAAKW